MLPFCGLVSGGGREIPKNPTEPGDANPKPLSLGLSPHLVIQKEQFRDPGHPGPLLLSLSSLRQKNKTKSSAGLRFGTHPPRQKPALRNKIKHRIQGPSPPPPTRLGGKNHREPLRGWSRAFESSAPRSRGASRPQSGTRAGPCRSRCRDLAESPTQRNRVRRNLGTWVRVKMKPGIGLKMKPPRNWTPGIFVHVSIYQGSHPIWGLFLTTTATCPKPWKPSHLRSRGRKKHRCHRVSFLGGLS